MKQQKAAKFWDWHFATKGEERARREREGETDR